MQEEVENRTVNLAISTTKLTFRTIVNGYNAWKRHHQAKAAQKSAQMPLESRASKNRSVRIRESAVSPLRKRI